MDVVMISVCRSGGVLLTECVQMCCVLSEFIRISRWGWGGRGTGRGCPETLAAGTEAAVAAKQQERAVGHNNTQQQVSAAPSRKSDLWVYYDIAGNSRQRCICPSVDCQLA